MQLTSLDRLVLFVIVLIFFALIWGAWAVKTYFDHHGLTCEFATRPELRSITCPP